MKNVPQPKEQARVLKAALSQLGLNIKHQDALSVVASLMGARNWPTLSADYEAAETQRQEAQKALSHIEGPADGNLFEALVTVDQTQSARIRVRAHSLDDAKRMFGAAACAQYPHGFELDEGNYRGPSDFYLGDSDAVTNLSEPEYECTNNDFGARVTWQDENFEYAVDLSRNEPDSSSDSRRAKVTQVLTLTKGTATFELQSGLEVYGYLPGYLKQAVREGDFNEDFQKLSRKLNNHIRRSTK